MNYILNASIFLIFCKNIYPFWLLAVIQGNVSLADGVHFLQTCQHTLLEEDIVYFGETSFMKDKTILCDHL